jgi:type I restriction enzyme, S subunit
MGGEWRETVLQEIAANDDRAFAMGPFGSNIKSENYRESGVPVIRGTNLQEIGGAPFIADGFVFLDEEKADNLLSSNCSPTDIVFVAQGTVGKVGIVPSDTPYRRFVLSQNLMKVTVDPSRADPRFVFYFYRSSAGQHEIMSRANPTGVPCISKPLTSLRQFGIRLPSNVSEQRAIAHILGTLDDKIELNRRMNETLEAMAQALFKSWFIDFDPVRDKAEGRESNLPKKIIDLFPDHFEDSELGKIPKGWSPSQWGELARLEYGKSLSAYESNAGPHPVYGTNGRIGTTSEPLCKHPGIVIGRKGAYRGVHFCSSPFFVIDTAFYVEPKIPMEIRWAYYELLQQDINSMDSGSAIPSTSRDDFYNLPVLSPPLEIQRCFAQLLMWGWLRQEHNEAESRSLTALRDLLLPKLISGELRLLDAERIVRRYV